MGALDDVGKVIGIAGSVFGTQSSGSGSSDTKINTTQKNISGSSLQSKDNSTTKGVGVNKGYSSQNTKGTSNQNQTATSGGKVTTVGTADSGALATAKGLTATALKNSTDNTQINDLINSTVGKAAIAFAPTGNQGVSNGIYNSSTVDMLSGFAQGQATADAAGAALQYKTNQEQIAEGSNADVLNATKGSTGNTTNTSTGNTNTSTSQNADTASIDTNRTSSSTQDLVSKILDSFSQSQGHTAQNTNSTQSSSGGGLFNSIICTELQVQGKLDRELYRIGIRHFLHNYPDYARKAYLIWAKPVVNHLQEQPDSKFSWAVCKVFNARAKYIAHKVQPKKYGYTILGHLASGLVAGMCWMVYLTVYQPEMELN